MLKLKYYACLQGNGKFMFGGFLPEFQLSHCRQTFVTLTVRVYIMSTFEAIGNYVVDVQYLMRS